MHGIAAIVAENEEGVDFELRDDAWLTCNGLSIQLAVKSDGLRIAVYFLRREMDDPVEEMFVQFPGEKP